VLKDAVAFSRPVWLTSHAELKTSARVRTAFDFLAEALHEGLDQVTDT